MVHKNAKIENCSGLTAISRDISFLNFYLLHTKDERKENAKWLIKMPQPLSNRQKRKLFLAIGISRDISFLNSHLLTH